MGHAKFLIPYTMISVGMPVSLAPPILESIYRGLGLIATHSDDPFSASISYPLHFLLIWLGSYFPGLYLWHGPKDCKMAWEYLLMMYLLI